MSMRHSAESLARRLQGAGFTAYFAGGCVRDELLGESPKDYDIATSATPAQVQRLFPKSQAVGAHFGVIVVREGGHQFEIATFRTDGSYRAPQKKVLASRAITLNPSGLEIRHEPCIKHPPTGGTRRETAHGGPNS